MKRAYASGAQKRAKAREKEDTIAKLPKISGFFQVLSTDEDQSDGVDLGVDSRRATDATVDIDQGPTISVNGDATICIPSPAVVRDESQVEEASSVRDERTISTVSREWIPTVTTQNDEETGKYPSDAALWTKTQGLTDYCLKVGPSFCQNRDSDFASSARGYEEDGKIKTRMLNISLFEIELTNNERIFRDWLLYSPSTGSVFCFYCKLFSTRNDQFSSSGFNDWKNKIRVEKHQNCHDHKACEFAYITRRKIVGCIDEKIATQLNDGFEYWKEVIYRCIDAIIFLATRGLALRGSNQEIGSTKNGNYLGLLELMSKRYPFLKNHIERYANKGKGHVSYLSANTCEDLIEAMGLKVLAHIAGLFKKYKYFSISVDSTPDTSRKDQLTFVGRYVDEQGPVERFLSFLIMNGHISAHMLEKMKKFMRDIGIDFDDCRGQSYDNVPNMSGHLSGLQTRLRAENSYADYVPCAGHSLNLVGNKAARCNLEVLLFFNILQALFVFFSSSPPRWKKLLSSLKSGESQKNAMKSPCKTRWSARVEAVVSLHDGLDNVKEVLESIINDKDEDDDTKAEAVGLRENLCKFDNVFLLEVWKRILTQIHITNLTLQKEETDLSIVVNLLDSLEKFLQKMRDEDFDQCLSEAKRLAHVEEMPRRTQRVTTRSVKITRFEGPAPDAARNFTADQRLRYKFFIPIIDSVCSGLRERRLAYSEIQEKFNFLVHLCDMENQNIRDNCRILAEKYDKDLCGESLAEECLLFKQYLIVSNSGRNLRFLDMYVKIKGESLTSTFPNLEISLRIFLCKMVTNCTGERSFSQLKIIKNDHRSTMLEPRLNHLAIMKINSDIVELLDYEDIIHDFALKKSRKRI